MSEILKQNINLKEEFKENLFGKYQVIIPIITIAELGETDNLLFELIDFSKNINVIISKSSRMIFEEEIKTFESKDMVNIELIDLTRSVCNDENHMKKYFVSAEFINAMATLKSEVNTGLANIDTLKKYDYSNSREYVLDYLLSRLKLKAPQIYDSNFKINENNNLDHFQSIKFQGAFLYYKYRTKNVKILNSDTYDALMIPTLPYVDVFITERTNCSIIRELKSKEKSIIGLDVLTIKDVRS